MRQVLRLAFVLVLLSVAKVYAAEGIPANAHRSTYSNSWVCDFGFRRVGAACEKVIPPENARLDYLGSSWVCNHGFRRAGSECLKVVPPENASLDHFGSSWVCNHGFRRAGSECLKVVPPENASLDHFGSSWVCNRGYQRAGSECLKVVPPENASLDHFGSSWVCNRGFVRMGNGCEQRAISASASTAYQPPSLPASAPPATGSYCAENGSCYGDPSALTGRPKTVHVNGYYRRDGTYVRGHYRSRPNR